MKKTLKIMVTAMLVMLIAASIFTVSYAADKETYIAAETLADDTFIRVGAELPSIGYFLDSGSCLDSQIWYKSKTDSQNLSDYTKCTSNIVEEGYNYIYCATVTPMWRKYFNSNTSFKLELPNGTYYPICKEIYDVEFRDFNDGYSLLFFISKEDIGYINVGTVDELREALGSSDNLNIRLKSDIKYEIPRGSKAFTPITVFAAKTLDLNGHSLEILDKTNVDKSSDFTLDSELAMFKIATHATLTVDDSVGGGCIKFKGDMIDVHMWALLFWDTSEYNDYATRDIFQVAGGKLIVNAGNFYAGNAKEQYLQDKVVYAHQIVTGTPVVVNAGEAVINGGYFEGYSVVEAGPGMSNAIFVDEKAKATINSGEFRLKGTGHMMIGTPEIKGGTFVAETYDHIRTLQTSATSNSYTDGKIGKYNIPDNSWHGTYVDAYEGEKLITSPQSYSFLKYTGTEPVKFVQKTVSGGINFTSGVAVGKSISVTLSGNIAEIYKNNPGAVSFEWMSAQAGTNRWITEEEHTKDFTPTTYHNGRDIRLAITVDGMKGKLYSSRVRVTKQSQDFGAPPTKAGAEVNYANAQITISDYSSAQEYVLTESTATPDWATAIRPDDGGVFRNLAKEKIYYIHTRYKETDEKAAGSKVVYTVADLREQVYLTGIELVAEKVYADAYTYVKITANPIPANAINFDGILGSKWILNSGTGSTAKLYATFRGMDINPGSYYKSVYLYGTQAETVNVSAEMTIGYNNIARAAVTIERADQDGKYAFSNGEIAYRPAFDGTSNITLAKGTSAVVSLVNNNSERGDKPIDSIGWSKNGGDTLIGISFQRIEGSNQVIVKASDTCTTGIERFNCVVNGVTMINKLVVQVVDAEIPAESISLDKHSLALKKSASEDLYAKVLPVNSTDNVVWTSSNTDVATVSGGRVTAKAAGTAVITAKAGEFATTCKVIVSDKADEHRVDVSFGTADKVFAAEGTKVTIKAGAAPENCAFDKWYANGVALSKPTASTTTFTMPANDVSLTASYKVVTLGKPKTVTATQTTNQIKLTWSAVPGAESYNVYQKNGSGWKLLGNVKNTEYTIKNLKAGTKYTFAVRAAWTKNGKFTLAPAFATYDTATKTVAANVKATPGANVIKLTWTKCAGATGYRILYKVGTSSSWKTALSATTATTVDVKGLTAGTKYSFAVRPYVKNGSTVVWSDYKEILTATKVVKPSKVTAKQTKNSITLSWTKCAGATGYRILVKSGSTWNVAVSSTSATSYTIKNLKAGTKYTYAVRPYIKNGSTVVWSDFTQLATATKAVKPSKVTAKQTTNSITLTWTKSVGATGYRIHIKSGSSWKTVLKATTATSHTFKNQKAGVKYTFAIQPYIKNGSNVIWGEYAEFTTASLPATVTAKVSSPSKGKVSVTWGAVNGADVYRVYYKLGNGSYKLYKTYSSVQKLNFNLKSGSKYTFAVRAGIKTTSGNIFGSYKAVSVTVK